MKGHYSNILVPTDFSEQSLLALEQSFTLARLLNVEITLLHIFEKTNIHYAFGLLSREPSEEELNNNQESCYARLLQIAESSSKNSSIKVNPLLLNGVVHEKILGVAKDIYARFIVMATNSSDPDKKKAFIGTTTANVILTAPCPVLTFNGTNIRGNFETIILPLDLTKQTQQKITKAIEFAKYYNSTIRVVSVLLTDEPDVVNRLTEQLKLVKEYIEKRDIFTTAKIIHGDPAAGGLTSYIIDFAYENNGDLIMIMTQQEVDAREQFLGSSAKAFITNAKIPVLSITPK